MSRSARGAPSVWACVVHYGDPAVTRDCLRALDRVRWPALFVALADNGGNRRAVHGVLAGLRRRPLVLDMGGNAGFARATNAGIAAARRAGAAYAWLLNNDAVPETGALAPLVRALERDPRGAIAGSRIHDNAEPGRIWHAGGRVDLATGETRSRGAGEIDRGQYRRPGTCDYVAGCSLLARMDVLDELGDLDERFVMYYEETDLCLRARAAGRRVLYVPGSRVLHRVAGREATAGSGWLFWETRNRLLFLVRHHPSAVPAALLRAWRWPILSAVARGRPGAALSALGGWLAFLGLLLTGRAGRPAR